MRTLYYLAIASARRSILIANPYFVPDQVAIDALRAARERGVEVKIIVSGIRNDNWLARQNSIRLFGPLLEAGVEIYEYNRTMLHQKTMVVDDAWAHHRHRQLRQPLVRLQRGEQRVDPRSRPASRAWSTIFDEDLAVSDPRHARARGGAAASSPRAQELVAALFEDQV